MDPVEAEAENLNGGRAKSVEASGGSGVPQRRRGPRTEEGKSHVRLNAVTHGLCAITPVIPGVEREEDWEAHRAGVVESLAPGGHLETVLAERVAFLLWRLRRVAAYEVAELVEVHKRCGNGSDRVYLPPEKKVDKLVRYEAHVSRVLYQTLHELEALQARRRGERAPLARLDVHGLPEMS